MSTLPTGTVTFLFTDLEGSTRLWELHPDAMRADLAHHDALLRAAITQHGGHVFKTVGDAFCAAFATAESALFAALAAQRALLGAAWEVGGTGLRARMCLHTGEAQERDGDYFGPALNRAARLRDIAHGGQTVVSQPTEQLTRDSLPDGISLRDLGSHRLKDLLRPEQVFQLHHPDLPDAFPALRSLNQFPHNLPQRLDSFIGRAAELDQVKRLLASSRLLTLTGVGGAGKTRLAQQAAAECLDRYPEGVWLLPLEALTDTTLIPQAVAAAVGVREKPGQSLTGTLCDAMRGHCTLLILDNCEHLIAACARFAQTLLQACPGVQILATSREALSISGEVTYPVPTLIQNSPPYPDQATSTDAASEAVRLFVDRAVLSLPSFTLTAQNAPIIARICRQLDGLPLAIELAAPRVKMLTPDQISQRLDKRFRLLTGGARTALPRQQTMRAAVQWSHDLLSEPERLLFRRLSVFAGGWTMEAAEAICTGGGLEEWDVMDLLSSLVAKSLVQADDTEAGGFRYRMLETLREYSLEQLETSPDGSLVYARHEEYFLSLAEQAEPELRGAQQQIWGDRLGAEQDNFRAALDRATGFDARLRLATALQRFWLMRGFTREGRNWLEDTLRQASESGSAIEGTVHAHALTAAGILAWSQGDYDVSWRFHEQGLALYQQQGDESGIAKTQMNLGIVADYREDYETARRNYETALAAYREIGDRSRTAFALVNLAAHFLNRGDAASAIPSLEECLSIRRSLNDRAGIAMALVCSGEVAFRRQDWPQARAQFVEALHIRQTLGDQPGMAACLFHLAYVAELTGDRERAVLLLSAAEAQCETVSVPLLLSAQQEHDLLKGTLQQALGPETYETLERQGRAMSRDQAVSLALSLDSSRASDINSSLGGIL